MTKAGIRKLILVAGIDSDGIGKLLIEGKVQEAVDLAKKQHPEGDIQISPEEIHDLSTFHAENLAMLMDLYQSFNVGKNRKL